MEEKQKFVCSYCGAEYDSAPARARCELECDEKRKQEIERVRKEKLTKEKKCRAEEIDRAYRDYVNLASKYHDDYGEVFSFKTIIGLPENFWDAFCV